MADDNWKHRSSAMRCATCMWFVPKTGQFVKAADLPAVTEELPLGRCRRRAPTLNGWPAVFRTDWCGDHKLDETKLG